MIADRLRAVDPGSPPRPGIAEPGGVDDPVGKS